MAARWGLTVTLLALIARASPACQVTLTARAPKASCPGISGPYRLLEVPVTKVENPSGQSFSIYVSLTAAKGAPVPVGNVTVYPADQTGVFTMRSLGAFEKLGAVKGPVRVLIEIKRTAGDRPWQPIRVSIGPLRWLTDEPK